MTKTCEFSPQVFDGRKVMWSMTGMIFDCSIETYWTISHVLCCFVQVQHNCSTTYRILYIIIHLCWTAYWDVSFVWILSWSQDPGKSCDMLLGRKGKLPERQSYRALVTEINQLHWKLGQFFWWMPWQMIMMSYYFVVFIFSVISVSSTSSCWNKEGPYFKTCFGTVTLSKP